MPKKVSGIFETMEYGTVKEDIELARVWLEKHQYASKEIKNIPFIISANLGAVDKNNDEIKQLIKHSKDTEKVWLSVPGVDKTRMLSRLAVEIEKHSILICQLEMILNNVLIKDTKDVSIHLLTEYIRYYAKWACIVDKQLPEYKPYGVCGCYFDSGITLGNIGLVIAPALAAGNVVVIGSSKNLFPIITLLIELCEIAGFPKGTIQLIKTSNFKIFLEYCSTHKITYCGDLYNKNNINLICSRNFTLMNLTRRTSIIFDSGDIDSAIESIVTNNSTWTTQGNSIYVQETIFDEFIERFKVKILKLNIGYNATDTMLDIVLNKRNHYDTDIVGCNKLPLRIGYKVFGDNILTTKTDDAVAIIPFRTVTEGIALVNNTNYTSSVFLWTENISLAYEVTSKLKTGIISINSDQYLSGNSTFSLYGDGGRGHFGGKDGLFEYLQCKKPMVFVDDSIDIGTTAPIPFLYYGGTFKNSENGLPGLEYPFLKEKDIRNCVESAKIAYAKWSKLSPKTRGEYLWKIAESSYSVEMSTINTKWIEFIQEWLTLSDSTESLGQQQGSSTFRGVKESIGLLVFHLEFDADLSLLKLLIAALAYGNAVIILNNTNKYTDFLKSLCKVMSLTGITSGVFNVIFNSDRSTEDPLVDHKETNAFIHSKCRKCPIKCAQKMRDIQYININSNREIRNLVTYNKCIWTSF